MKLATICRSLAAALIVVTPGCGVLDGMVGTSVPDLAGQWLDAKDRAVELKQGGFVLEAAMLDEPGKSEWTNASGTCSDTERLEMSFFQNGEKTITRQGLVQSNAQLVGQSIKWSDGGVWRRAPQQTETQRPKSQPHLEPDKEVRPRSQPHQKPDPIGK